RATTAPRGGADALAAIHPRHAGPPAPAACGPVPADHASVPPAPAEPAPTAASDRGGRSLRQDRDRPSPAGHADTADPAPACTPAANAPPRSMAAPCTHAYAGPRSHSATSRVPAPVGLAAA